MVLDECVAAITDAKDSGLPMQLGLEVDFFPETIEGPRNHLVDLADSNQANPTRDGADLLRPARVRPFETGEPR